MQLPGRRMLKNLDFTMLVTAMAIMAFGVIVIWSASPAHLHRQVIWVVLGLGLVAATLTINYSDLTRFANIIYVLNLGLLGAVAIAGRTGMGAQRWIAIGSFEFQPSELAKIAIIITLAAYLSRREGKMDDWPSFFWPFLHVAPPMLLIMMQPDLGTSLVFAAVLAGMMFVAGAPVKKLAITFGGGLTAIVAWISLHLRFPEAIWIPLKEYQLKRLVVFLDPGIAPLKEGYHIIQSRIAIGSGGFLGKGLFNGTQTRLSFLPEQHTDFIFAVVGEELGFIGGAVLIFLLLLFLLRGLKAATQTEDMFGTLIVTGIVSMWAFQIVVNIGMTIGVMPVTGIPLPFVSYGGSSLLANCIALGLLQGVFMRRQKILF
ncbi:MAG: rod shape-determining protein RodA [Bacillota bacterium]|jgi:rod shape determining protein RodA